MLEPCSTSGTTCKTFYVQGHVFAFMGLPSFKKNRKLPGQNLASGLRLGNSKSSLYAHQIRMCNSKALFIAFTHLPKLSNEDVGKARSIQQLKNRKVELCVQRHECVMRSGSQNYAYTRPGRINKTALCWQGWYRLHTSAEADQ